jgi:acetyl-CoA carboxylase biotin carboxyl carrier protein
MLMRIPHPKLGEVTSREARPRLAETGTTRRTNMARIEVKAEVTGKVWKIVVPVGSRVEADDSVMIVESMKMEIPVVSEEGGTVVELRVAEGDPVEDGQVVAIVES